VNEVAERGVHSESADNLMAKLVPRVLTGRGPGPGCVFRKTQSTTYRGPRVGTTHVRKGSFGGDRKERGEGKPWQQSQ
jgi:hypothetical protein